MYSGDNHTYFIKDAMVWRLNTNKEFTSSIDTDYPQFVARWLHIGEKITAALRWINGRNYFFSYKSYYRYDHINHQVEIFLFLLNSFIFLFLKKVDDSYPTYPRPISEWWLQCNQGTSSPSEQPRLYRWKRASIIYEFNDANLKHNYGQKNQIGYLFIFTTIITYYL
jgi:hypothetical protein